MNEFWGSQPWLALKFSQYSKYFVHQLNLILFWSTLYLPSQPFSKEIPAPQSIGRLILSSFLSHMTRHNNRGDSPLHLCKLGLTSQALVGWLSSLARFRQPVWGSCVSRRYWLMRRALPINPLVYYLSATQLEWTGRRFLFNCYLVLLSLNTPFLSTHSLHLH